MHHCLLISLGVILTLTSIHSLGAAESIGAEALKLPPDAAALMQSYETDVAKLEADCAKSVAGKSDALRIKLTKAQENATKKGDLEGALAIKDTIEKLPKAETKKVEAEQHTSRDVILYTEPNFKGQSLTLKQFNVVLEAYKVNFPNDSLRSVKVPAGYTLVAYISDLGGGASTEYTSDTPNITDAPGMGMTSFMIRKSK